jgi:hypothetical protein
VTKFFGLRIILTVNEAKIIFRSFFTTLKITKIDREFFKSGLRVLKTREHDVDQLLIRLLTVI